MQAKQKLLTEFMDEGKLLLEGEGGVVGSSLHLPTLDKSAKMTTFIGNAIQLYYVTINFDKVSLVIIWAKKQKQSYS